MLENLHQSFGSVHAESITHLQGPTKRMWRREQEIRETERDFKGVLAEGRQGRVQRRRTRCFVFRDALFAWLQRDVTRNGWTQKIARNISRRVVLVGDAHVTVPIHANKHEILLAVKKRWSEP